MRQCEVVLEVLEVLEVQLWVPSISRPSESKMMAQAFQLRKSLFVWENGFLGLRNSLFRCSTSSGHWEIGVPLYYQCRMLFF